MNVLRRNDRWGSVMTSAVLLVFAIAAVAHIAGARADALGIPAFEVDPNWPKLTGNWIFGSIGGIAVDPTNDHVWVLQRPRTLDNDENYAAQQPPVGDCCVPASPVMEFDPEGNLVGGWGGPGQEYEWPQIEHGITIDPKGNVWILGNGKMDHQALKFTKGGTFLLQIGHAGKSEGSNDTANLNEATKAVVYPKTNEVFISDGYVNRRIIVFDADTGAYKRHWGAYGKRPDDAAPRTRVFRGDPPQQFNLVHSVLVSKDDLVYVGDRTNNRIQVFRPDGTFVKEAFVAREVATSTGTAMDLAFSPDPNQRFLYVSGGDQHIRILERDTLQVVGTIGRLGHYPGQFHHIHVMAIDSKGNLYTGETNGKRVQKFTVKTPSPTSAYAPAFPRDGARLVKDGKLVAIWDVTRPKGRSSGIREHPFDEIEVTLNEGTVKTSRPDGTSSIQHEPFASVHFEPKGATRSEEGVSDRPGRVVVFQLKPAEAAHIPPTQGIPGQFPRVGAHQLFETDRVRVWDQTWRAGERITRHLHYGQTAAVFLVGGKLRTIDDGNPPNAPFVRAPGDVLFSDTLTPLKVPHEEEQVEGSPRAIWLEFK